MEESDFRNGTDGREVTRLADGRTSGEHAAVPRDTAAIEAELRRAVEGEIRFDAQARALYAADASNYRQVPVAVVLPRSYDDVAAALAACRKFDMPVLSRGCGTSLSGETCNTAVIIDFSRHLDGVLAVDAERRIGRVQAGCILDDLRDAAEAHHLTFGPDPATHDHCTFGGMLGNNSGGVHTLVNGITVHNVRSMEIITYDGLRLSVGPTPPEALRAIQLAGGRRAEIYRKLVALRDKYEDLMRARYPQIPRRVSGFENLDQLFDENGFNVAKALVGTEGTCVTILEAEFDLIPSPREHVVVILGFTDVYAAADRVPEVLRHGPMALEGMDHLLADFIRKKDLDAKALSLLPEGKGWLICQFGADSEEEAIDKAQALCRQFEAEGASSRLLTKADEREKIWEVRESALGATAWVPDADDTWPGWEDSAVHRDNLGDYLRDLRKLMQRYGYEASFYGHFGDGLVHCRVDFDLRQEKGLEVWRDFLSEAADLVVSYGGSLSGEHGDGQARGALLERMYGPELVECFREFKAIWDPRGRMNPGKVVDAYPITSNLRVGPTYEPPQLATTFGFPADRGSFARATMRCVGVGKCRRTDNEGGVMCPSFLATREEKHSTRGRAHLLFEMAHGGIIEEGWKSDAVEDVLKLCLACKGCKSDCPVNVDMASYKAEFRSHYYEGRLRPRSAYSMGLIYWWARLATNFPAIANLALQAPGIGSLAKAVGGIAQTRDLPPLARQNFRHWFARRPRRPGAKGRVLLWPDTFTTYFRPETGIAATRVLEAAGFEVTIPSRPLCCGRPLYDQGMLGRAVRLWRQTLDTLGDEIDQGTPVIGLEPACTTAFKDELGNLFPDDERAKKLGAQTVFFSDFMVDHLDRLELRAEQHPVLVHPHCNHHAVLKTDGERRLLEALELDYRFSDAGCCGMAGAFGFAADTCDVSMTIGERSLLPMVRGLETEALVLADGFSCREQIEQGTGRATLHVAQLLDNMIGDARR